MNLNVDLPKWPQMLVWGKPVTIEQAKEIILRTDSFLNGGYASGNNHNWIEWARKTLGLDCFDTDYYNQKQKYDWNSTWAMRKAIQEELKVVPYNYVHNTWASSSYIYGPYGWCHPDGAISFTDNVGKWPSAEEVFEDWCSIAQAFPYLDLYVTLMSGEQGEDDKHPVISFRVLNGTVEVLNAPVMPDHVVKREFNASTFLDRSEQGLPDEWIEEYAKITKPVVEKFKHMLKPYKED